MTAALDYLLVEDALPAAIITLNRPQQLNPLSTGLMRELTSELERQGKRPEVRAIVLKGAGRAFSAGHDLKEMMDRSLDEERDIFAVCNKLMATVHAMEMLLTGRFVDAGTAEKWGLINRAVPLERLDGEVMALVQELSKLSRYALSLGKEGFYQQVEEKQAEAYRLMAEAISCNAVAPDGKEGIAAFVEKRAPVWRGAS